MLLSEIASIIEQTARYPLVGIRQDQMYVLADLGHVNAGGYASPTMPFVVHQMQLADPAAGAAYLRILANETCEKLDRAVEACAAHP